VQVIEPVLVKEISCCWASYFGSLYESYKSWFNSSHNWSHSL